MTFCIAFSSFIQDIPGADIDAQLIVLTVQHCTSSSCPAAAHCRASTLFGDGCIINIKAHCSTAYGSLAVLVAYYVFDANYPAQYAMLLAILQIFVMQEPNTRQTCQKFELFVKKLRSLFDCIFVSD